MPGRRQTMDACKLPAIATPLEHAILLFNHHDVIFVLLSFLGFIFHLWAR